MEIKKSVFPAEGYVRINQILAPRGPVPISKSSWWAGVDSGKFPKPTKFFGPGITAWNVKDIRDLLNKAAEFKETENTNEKIRKANENE